MLHTVMSQERTCSSCSSLDKENKELITNYNQTRISVLFKSLFGGNETNMLICVDFVDILKHEFRMRKFTCVFSDCQIGL